ncbi:MAG: helix-turn-helix domain-containing protein [Rhizobium sp.]|nr:helix-turn-helix domain-containing protein [Rhizobium sp.]
MNDIVAKRIQSRLDELGKNPSSVALEAGLGRSSVRDILLGRVKNPRIDTIRKIAGPLQCTVDYLTGESDDPGEYSIADRYWFMDGGLGIPHKIEAGVFRPKPRPLGSDAEIPGLRGPYPPEPRAASILDLVLPDTRVPRWAVNLYRMMDNSLEDLHILAGDSLSGAIHPDDFQIPLTHGSLVAIRQTLKNMDLEEYSVRLVKVTEDGVSLSCKNAPDVIIPLFAIENESTLLPNFYVTDTGSIEILGVILRVIRELELSDALRDFSYNSD